MEEQSLKVEPDDYAAHLYLGTMLLKQGDPASAVAQYRAALAQGPPADAAQRRGAVHPPGVHVGWAAAPVGGAHGVRRRRTLSAGRGARLPRH